MGEVNVIKGKCPIVQLQQKVDETEKIFRGNNMLVLPIKKQWFDKILSGEKTKEYREIKPYYTTRFTTIDLLDTSGRPTNSKVWIIFRNGYSSKSPSFEALCQLSIGLGRTEWGAEAQTKYYKLKILKIKR